MVERRDRIVELVQLKGEVTLGELRAEFPNVSEMTLRRDLDYLDRKGLLVRVHGGAKSLEAIIGLTEERYAQRSVQRVPQKNLIASKAVNLLTANSVIFIDSGTTTTAFSRALPDLNLRIFTSGLTCALELARLKDSSVEIVGGELNKRSFCSMGAQATKQIQSVNFDIAFLGAAGFDLERGFTTGWFDDRELKRAAIERSQKVVILVDSSKIGKVNAYTFARLEEVGVVVSDDEFPEETILGIKSKGVELL